MTPDRRRRLDQVLVRRQPDLTVLAENLHKPRNFSAVIRTCDAVGVHEVHAVPGEVHPRRYWHTSQGAEKWVRLRCHDDTAGACDWLRDAGFAIVTAHLTGEVQDFRAIDYTKPTALVIGTESFGVTGAAVERADQLISIPMMGMSQSLNVSVACAIVLYEAQRQRQAAGLYDRRRLDDAAYERLRFEWLHPKLAGFCRERGLAYPALNAEGELIGPLPRG